MKINVGQELREIRMLLGSACVMEAVRKEVLASLQGKKALVIDGEHAQSRVAGGSGYDVVVIASESNQESMELLARRLRAKLPDAAVERIGVDGVLGVKGARRGSKKE